jgi:hypothetical protein
MTLPGGHLAIVDPKKLSEYCLNPEHPRGRNQARVFAAVGIQPADAELLTVALLEAALTADAQPSAPSPFGQRFTIDFDMDHRGKTVKIRSAWIIRKDEGLPRLTSCYVL